jgi:aryl-alcohol dehydrogenase-like predicted oxidoreductase
VSTNVVCSLVPRPGSGHRVRAVLPLGGGNGPYDAKRLGKVAARLGATTAQVGIASLLAKSPSVLAIPGTGSLDHLEENLAANDLSLSDEDLADLRG